VSTALAAKTGPRGLPDNQLLCANLKRATGIDMGTLQDFGKVFLVSPNKSLTRKGGLLPPLKVMNPYFMKGLIKLRQKN